MLHREICKGRKEGGRKGEEEEGIGSSEMAGWLSG